MHLRYDYMEANIVCHEMRRAQVVMNELGISYTHSTPQSMADSFWFWNCTGVPDELPRYLSELKLDPMDQIGWGLSKEMAIEIKSIQDALVIK